MVDAKVQEAGAGRLLHAPVNRRVCYLPAPRFCASLHPLQTPGSSQTSLNGHSFRLLVTFSDCNCQETSSIITSEALGRRKVWGVWLVRAQQWLRPNQWSLDKEAHWLANKLRLLPSAKCMPGARRPIKSWLQGATVTWFLYFLKNKYWEVHLTIYSE